MTGLSRLPPAEMMYWATWPTRGTPELKRFAMTSSTRAKSRATRAKAEAGEAVKDGAEVDKMALNNWICGQNRLKTWVFGGISVHWVDYRERKRELWAVMNCAFGACQVSKVRAKIRGSLGFVLGIPLKRSLCTRS